MVKKLTDAELVAEVRRATASTPVMEGSEPRARTARYDRETDLVELALSNGCFFAFPAARAQGLSGADPEALEGVEVLGDGQALRWDALDADFSVPGLLAGRMGSRRWMAQEMGRAGGRVSSDAKARAARENGKRGGRPRKA